MYFVVERELHTLEPSAQSVCQWLMNTRRYCSTSWFTLSVCPSVCGWYAVERFPCVPTSLYKSFMNCVANWGPLSLITFLGILYLLHTWSLKILATPWAVTPVCVGRMMIILVNISHITRITLYPCDSGSSPIMSIEICSQGCLGISFGCRGACSFPRCAFVLWHVSQPSTYFLTSAWMYGHQ